MPMTPDSSNTPYATYADFVLRYDVRSIGNLIKDDNTRANDSEVSASSVVEAMLLDASGQVESACQVGRRYQPADLQALTGASESHLKRIVCDIAYGLLRQRRGSTEPISPAYAQAVQYLRDLRDGAAIFSFDESQAAGLAKDEQLTRRDLLDVNRPSVVLRRAFGSRIQDRYPAS